MEGTYRNVIQLPDQAVQESDVVTIPKGKDVWMWHLRTWFSGGLVTDGLTVGLDDL